MTLPSKMLVLLVTVCALAAGARADCDACVAGQCHARRPLVTGFPVTDQLAVDRTNNVLYLQFNNFLNTAIFLDDGQSRLVNMMRTWGMAVSQETQVLYLGGEEVNDQYSYYMYNLASNRTEAVKADGNTKSRLMFYSDNILHYIRYSDSLSCFNNMTSNRLWHYKSLEGVYMNDFVIGEDRKIFYVSNNTVYVYLNRAKYDTQPPEVITNKNHVLSVDKHDTVYFADVTEKVIYKRDKATKKLKVYAAYSSGSIEDFVFDKDNRIVFRDGDSVAQWVPAAAHKRCAFDPQGGFFMKVV